MISRGSASSDAHHEACPKSKGEAPKKIWLFGLSRICAYRQKNGNVDSLGICQIKNANRVHMGGGTHFVSRRNKCARLTLAQFIPPTSSKRMILGIIRKPHLAVFKPQRFSHARATLRTTPKIIKGALMHRHGRCVRWTSTFSILHAYPVSDNRG